MEVFLKFLLLSSKNVLEEFILNNLRASPLVGLKTVLSIEFFSRSSLSARSSGSCVVMGISVL